MSPDLRTPPTTHEGVPLHPGPAMRGEKFLTEVEVLLRRLDAVIGRALAAPDNPLTHLGPVANLLFAIAVGSGVVLLIWYSPSVHLAYDSLQQLGGWSLGGWMRSVHRYSSDAAVLFVALHALRALVARQVTGARWLPWVSGVLLLGLLWFVGWTGYWLVWDERGQLIARASLKFADVLPVFGGPLGRLLATDDAVPSLLFFVVFFLHMLLPLAFVAGMCVHLARLSRAKILPARTLTVWTVAAVAVVSLLVPAASAGPARMAVTPDQFAIDAWYLWPLAVTERLSGAGLWVLATALFLGFGGLPWWLARRRPRESFQARVDPARCHACTQCTQDCPFNAITMVPRTDGKRFANQAQVDPARCVGCGVCAGSCDSEGIGLTWFDARVETARIEQRMLDAARTKACPLALVATDSHAAWSRFDPAAWRNILPVCTVVPVPSAGWIPPKLLERALAAGAPGIVVVSATAADSAGRDGAIWFDRRLAGTRKPHFSPDRATTAPDRVLRLEFDPAAPERTRALVEQFAAGLHPASPNPAPRRAITGGLALAATLALVTVAASVAPFRNPASAAPELVLSLEAWGDWLDTAPASAAELAQRPVHMRNATVATHRERAPVRVTLTIDGVTTTETVRPLGLSRDGACLALLRRPLSPGIHEVAIALATTPDAPPRFTWSGRLECPLRRVTTIVFTPTAGFRVVP